MAAQQVFDIVELAEMIFPELSMRDVLVSVQRTRRSWKAVIDSATPIQQALFKKPICTTHVHHYEIEISDSETRHKWAETEDSVDGAAVIERPLLTAVFDDRKWAYRILTDGRLSVTAAQLATQPAVATLQLEVDDKIRTIMASGFGLTIRDLDLAFYTEVVRRADVHIEAIGYAAWDNSTVNEKLRDLRRRMLGRRKEGWIGLRTVDESDTWYKEAKSGPNVK